MALTDTEVRTIVISRLTDDERRQGVVYLASDPVAAGTTLELPRTSLQVPWDARLAFVDSEALANWGHRCRYILIHRETGETVATDARFPPFSPADRRQWHVIYQAPGVPDTALAAPKE